MKCSPLHDLGDCVLECAQCVVVKRAESVALVGGRQQKPVYTEIKIAATVIPGQDTRELSEDGQFASESITLYTVDEVFSISRSPVGIADKVCIKDEEFCVDAVKDWFHLGGYYEVIASRAAR